MKGMGNQYSRKVVGDNERDKGKGEGSDFYCHFYGSCLNSNIMGRKV
jgi:hypothetical protein